MSGAQATSAVGPAAPREAWQVPDYSVVELSPKATRYCVIIPVINEGERIRRQLEGMAESDPGADIVIADGGSQDGSLDLDFLKGCGVSALLTKTGPGRLSAQLRMGFAWALQRGYQGVVTIDGNGKDGFQAIPDFLAALDEGYGFVQGSRYLPGGEAVRTPLDRTLAVKLIHAPVLSLGAGYRYSDTTNGFRAFSAAFLSDPRVNPFRDVFDTYNLHYYLSVRAPRLGYRVKEIPVRRAYPLAEKTPTKISGLAGRLSILGQLLRAAAGGYNP